MPNPLYKKFTGGKAPSKAGKPAPGLPNESTANWPDPGKTQPRARNAGVSRVKQSVRQKGL